MTLALSFWAWVGIAVIALLAIIVLVLWKAFQIAREEREDDRGLAINEEREKRRKP
jgi:membrane protein implicated in regulation of membrane protease activity